MSFAITMVWRKPANTLATITFVWMIPPSLPPPPLPQLQKECQKRRNGQWSIQKIPSALLPCTSWRRTDGSCDTRILHSGLRWWSWWWPEFSCFCAINVSWLWLWAAAFLSWTTPHIIEWTRWPGPRFGAG